MKTTVFVDLETSGLREDSEIIQVAALVVDSGWREVEGANLEVKVKFDEARAESEALAINHYQREIWDQEAREPREVCQILDRFFRQFSDHQLVGKKGRPYWAARLAGFNIQRFDGPRLQKMFETWGKFFPCDYKFRDVMQLGLWWADRLEIPMPNHQLQTFLAHFGIEAGSAHDALSDVRATVKLTRRLLHEMANLSAAGF